VDEDHRGPSTIERVVVGGGEMGARIRAFDWGATPLGPIAGWPQSLRSAVSILLPSRAQIVAVRLPGGAATPGSPPLPAERRLDGLRALIVDDQPDAWELVALALRQRGADTRVAGSVAEALELLAAEPATRW
jgi:hypothetical protein